MYKKIIITILLVFVFANVFAQLWPNSVVKHTYAAECNFEVQSGGSKMERTDDNTVKLTTGIKDTANTEPGYSSMTVVFSNTGTKGHHASSIYSADGENRVDTGFDMDLWKIESIKATLNDGHNTVVDLTKTNDIKKLCSSFNQPNGSLGAYMLGVQPDNTVARIYRNVPPDYPESSAGNDNPLGALINYLNNNVVKIYNYASPGVNTPPTPTQAKDWILCIYDNTAEFPKLKNMKIKDIDGGNLPPKIIIPASPDCGSPEIGLSFASYDVWEGGNMSFTAAAAMYATFFHTAGLSMSIPKLLHSVQDTTNNVFFTFVDANGTVPLLVTVDIDGDVEIYCVSSAGIESIVGGQPSFLRSANINAEFTSFYKNIINRVFMPWQNGDCTTPVPYQTTFNTYSITFKPPGKTSKNISECLYAVETKKDTKADGWLAHWKVTGTVGGGDCSMSSVLGTMTEGLGAVLERILSCMFTLIFEPMVRWAAEFLNTAGGLSYLDRIRLFAFRGGGILAQHHFILRA